MSNQNQDVKEKNKEYLELEEQFKDDTEVVKLKAKLPGMSKSEIKTTTDNLRAEISQLSNTIKELKKKRAEHNAEARHYRSMRNNANDEKSQAIEKLKAQAEEEKEMRDEYNEKIRENKEQREKLSTRTRETWAKVKELQERYYRMKDEVGVMPEELTNEIRELEWKQQTTSLSPDEDADLTKKISELYEMAYTAHLIDFDSEELEQTIALAKKLSKEHDEAHENVVRFAEKSQEHHEKMLALYDKINQAYSGGNILHEKFLFARKAADTAHQKIVETYEKIKLRQYLLDLIDDEQIRRRHEQTMKLMEEKKEETEKKRKSNKRLTLDELRLLMREENEE